LETTIINVSLFSYVKLGNQHDLRQEIRKNSKTLLPNIESNEKRISRVKPSYANPSWVSLLR
jgi:cell wall assembly regulator SMI1